MTSAGEEGSSSSDMALSSLPSVVVDPAVLASKRVVFVGALPDEATMTMVRAAMIPFGDIKSVDMVRKFLPCGVWIFLNLASYFSLSNIRFSLWSSPWIM